MSISEQVAARAEHIVSIRRDLHKVPELAFQEKKTSEYIERFLKTLAPDRLERICGTGIKCVFGLDKPGPATAVRADIDALPISEKTGLAFASQNQGVMHACGHDGHMAMALAAAQIVSESMDRVQNPIVFIFQPAEETTGGALPMIEHGVLHDPVVGSIYGLHLWPYIDEGLLGLHEGPLMASMSDLDIAVCGRSCHGASPQDGADAIVAACSLITSLQSVVSRNIDPYEAAVLSFGRISGGEARNVVCGSVEIEGTVRAFLDRTNRRIHQRIDEMLHGLETMFEVNTSCTESIFYPAVDNPRVLVDEVRALLSPEDWIDPQPVMMAEDFAFYQRSVPGLFAFLGTRSAEHDSPLHSETFDFDEKVLLIGVEYYLRVIGCV